MPPLPYSRFNHVPQHIAESIIHSILFWYKNAGWRNKQNHSDFSEPFVCDARFLFPQEHLIRKDGRKFHLWKPLMLCRPDLVGIALQTLSPWPRRGCRHHHLFAIDKLYTLCLYTCYIYTTYACQELFGKLSGRQEKNNIMIRYYNEF